MCGGQSSRASKERVRSTGRVCGERGVIGAGEPSERTSLRRCALTHGAPLGSTVGLFLSRVALCRVPSRRVVRPSPESSLQPLPGQGWVVKKETGAEAPDIAVREAENNSREESPSGSRAADGKAIHGGGLGSMLLLVTCREPRRLASPEAELKRSRDLPRVFFSLSLYHSLPTASAWTPYLTYLLFVWGGGWGGRKRRGGRGKHVRWAICHALYVYAFGTKGGEWPGRRIHRRIGCRLCRDQKRAVLIKLVVGKSAVNAPKAGVDYV